LNILPSPGEPAAPASVEEGPDVEWVSIPAAEYEALLAAREAEAEKRGAVKALRAEAEQFRRNAYSPLHPNGDQVFLGVADGLGVQADRIEAGEATL
jgi:hypothetical protein